MPRTRFQHRAITAIVASLLASSCGRAGTDVSDSADESRLPPPAAALSAESGFTLETRLERLDGHLTAVLQGGLDDQSQTSLLAAEAATDRLLEEEPAAEWLGTGYLVEARLRQIQALADRIVAELGRGVARELILEDVASLRLAVRDLRTHLAAQGNGDAPPPLDSLLVAYENDPPTTFGRSAATTSTDTSTTAPTSEPTVAPEGGPLGEPIRP